MRNIAAGTIVGYFNGYHVKDSGQLRCNFGNNSDFNISFVKYCIRASFDCCNVSIERQERAQVDRSCIMITTANINEGEELVVTDLINVALVAS
jgi:hypothetical protein